MNWRLTESLDVDLDRSSDGSSIAGVESGPGSLGRKLPLSEPERSRISYGWNDTEADFPQLCAHQLFEQQVERNPSAVAIVLNEQQVSYGELNRRANQLAHYLRRQGVGPESLVGVCMHRSPMMVAALLGVWKAGGAYVPIDPAYPTERVSFMVQDAALQVLLTEKSCEHLFPSQDKTVFLDADWTLFAQEDPDNLNYRTVPENLAYVMYTSGSTGTPKGAMILHRGLVNYLTWAIRKYGMEAGGSVPLHSSIAFDLTVTALYTPLLAGAQVELLAEDSAAQSLVAALRRSKGRSLVKITPAHLELLSHEFAPEEVSGITKAFIIGGENLLAERLQLWREFAPATRLINEYGPTETVVGCCVYEVQADDPSSGSVCIGRPIANTQLYVLDPDLQPVPVGETGELYIGGEGVARGYWNRPKLTAERFLPDPFSGRPDARLYKSGDLVRYREDGNLEYLGRVDNQIKLRGYRIELGEIEAALASHPAVGSCTVLLREDEPGNQQLVGYLSPAKDQFPDPEELHSFLKRRLPEYMLPARLVLLESLPLTTNGKIDRNALPAPDPETTKHSHDFVAPRTAAEKAMAAIWSELLKVERIGITDNFFDLGGHSLLAFKAASRIRDAFDLDLPAHALFTSPTIAELAEGLLTPERKPSWSSLVPLRSSGSRPPLFLMHAHGGHVLDYHALAELLDQDQPVYALQARGLDGNIPTDCSIEETISSYIEEIRSLQPEGPYFLAGFCFGGVLALEAAHQLRDAGQEVALVMVIQPLPVNVFRRTENVPFLRRWWYQVIKRIDLERISLAQAGKGHLYILERFRRAWDLFHARATIAIHKRTGKRPTDLSKLPRLYIFEALGTAFMSAVRKYALRPYSGDVVLFRASKQLRGFESDMCLGWKEHLNGNLEVCEIPGHQQNILLQPTVKQLAGALGSRLKAAQQR